MMQLLVERGILDAADCRQRIAALRAKMLERADSIGMELDLNRLIDDPPP
jgi:hypothetical protein